MRLNETGLYEVTEGEDFIVDPESGEKMLFLIDKEHMLVLRSMTEEDIKFTVKQTSIASKEKRQMIGRLMDAIKLEDSQNYLFIAEMIVGEEQESNRWDEIYETGRKIIGFGERVRDNCRLDIILFKNEEGNLLNMRSLVNHVVTTYEILGERNYWLI